MSIEASDAQLYGFLDSAEEALARLFARFDGPIVNLDAKKLESICNLPLESLFTRGGQSMWPDPVLCTSAYESRLVL